MDARRLLELIAEFENSESKNLYSFTVDLVTEQKEIDASTRDANGAFTIASKIRGAPE